MNIIDVELARIVVGTKRRKTSKANVRRLADSILQIGLQHPIGLTPSGTDFTLVHGRHRLEAYRELGRATIPAIIVELDQLRLELAEIDENLLRSQLTELEESQALARRKDVWETLFPETKHGGDRKSKRQNVALNPSFTEDTASKTGKSKRTIERKVEIGEKLSPKAAEKLADKPISENQSELRKLSRLPACEQEAIADAIANDEIDCVDDYFVKEETEYPPHGFTKKDTKEAYAICIEAANSCLVECCTAELKALISAILELSFVTGNRTVFHAKMESLAESIK